MDHRGFGPEWIAAIATLIGALAGAWTLVANSKEKRLEKQRQAASDRNGQSPVGASVTNVQWAMAPPTVAPPPPAHPHAAAAAPWVQAATPPPNTWPAPATVRPSVPAPRQADLGWVDRLRAADPLAAPDRRAP